MLHSFVIGLGRAGSELHLRSLTRARAAAGELFAAGPVVGCDSDPEARRTATHLRAVPSVPAAAEVLDPERTVAHVCTPPAERAAVLTELAAHGFRRVIVEKPLATDPDELAAVHRVVERHGLDVAVVTHWLDSELTARLTSLVRGARLGALRAITVTQHKPRFTRSTTGSQHPTAFDVEVPHSLGLVLRLAGPADLLDAECTDMHSADAVLPGCGSARLSLQHHAGVRTDIVSDLTSPVQERRIALDFSRGRATGHFPISERDDHAQLVIDDQLVVDGQFAVGGRRQVFRDDALTTFLTRAYRNFATDGGDHGTFGLHCDIVRLLAAAKRHCAGNPAPAERIAHHAG